MLSQIKIYIGAFVGVVIGVLAWLVNYQSKRADNAEERAETAEENVTFTEERIKRNEDKKEIEQDVALGDEPHIDERLSKYFRDN